MSKLLIHIAAEVAILISVAQVASSQTRTVLGSLNCGGYQATCFQQTTGFSGAVRCTCTAVCLGQSCPNPEVAATRSVQWGSYVNRFCVSQLTGTARGGPTLTASTTTQTAVFAKVTVTGFYLPIGGTSSTQIADCYEGLIANDPPIAGLC